MNHPSDGARSLQQCIVDSRNGDEAALNQLAEYLLPKAFETARHRMKLLSPMDDYEDVAISAVKSVCQRIRTGQSEFLGEKELGGLLRRFVIGKIGNRRKYHLAEKRDVNANLKVDNSQAGFAVDNHAVLDASIFLDEKSAVLPIPEKEYLEKMLSGLGADVQGLFSELVKQLDEKPRKVLMLMTSQSMDTMELAEAMDCAPTSIERYRRAIRKKLEEIVNG